MVCLLSISLQIIRINVNLPRFDVSNFIVKSSVTTEFMLFIQDLKYNPMRFALNYLLAKHLKGTLIVILHISICF